MNESIDHGGKHLYHFSVGPLREVRKTLHNTTSLFEYKFTRVVNVRLDLMYCYIFQYSTAFRSWVEVCPDAMDKWVQMNSIIVNIGGPKFGVAWGFLLITVGGELSMIFLISRFDMGGFLKG